ncbi:hypothetical protein TUM12151_21530 [Morganella morganii]|nr:hypothetical protein TUM12149_22400 [Morganella morganii]GIZ31331.1 hypothetical protein TUM12150_18170 [Morganella morganii]GIZ35167.1 hypothetical protein TUM12151_21530 [Morganella morganii]
MTRKQFAPDKLLETLHLLTYGRLGAAYCRSCRCEGVQIRYCHERPQQIEIQV